jgi:predicted MFS family arabinose efflux permease
MQASAVRPTDRSVAPSSSRIPAVLMVWLGVNALDAALTLLLIGLGGIEGNPMLSYLQGEMGAVWMLSIKLAIAAAVGLTLVLRDRSPMLALANKLMALVVVYNAVVAFYYFAPSATMPFIS